MEENKVEVSANKGEDKQQMEGRRRQMGANNNSCHEMGE